MDTLKHGRERKKLKALIYPALLLALLSAAAVAISIGAVSYSFREIGGIFLELFGLPCRINIEAVKKDILLQLRMPRVVLAGAVGASLATAGATFQGLFRNPMADSYVIGVSSGAALGAVAAMLIGLPAAWGGIGAVPLFAFAGGVLTPVSYTHLDVYKRQVQSPKYSNRYVAMPITAKVPARGSFNISRLRAGSAWLARASSVSPKPSRWMPDVYKRQP